MKLKGIKPLEQHIEKIVLVVVLLVLLAVVSMQFLIQPNAVEVSASRSVPPENVYTELEGQAQRIESQLNDLNPELPVVAPTDLVARYDQVLANSSPSTMLLSSALGQGVDITEIYGVPRDPTPSGDVGALVVPVTSAPIAASSWATLDPYAMQEVPEYSSYVPTAQPYDFTSVSIEATFNGQDLRAALTGENGGDAIPRKFWAATGVTIVGFEVERQQMLPTGSWGTSEPIDTPPMTSTPTRSITTSDGLPELTQLVSNASGAFEDLAHPQFPPTIAGPEWTPPSERVEVDTSSLSKGDKLKRKLAAKERDLARLEGKPRSNTGGRPGSGGKSILNTDPGQGSSTGNDERKRARMDRLRDDIKELQDELREMGEDVDTDAGQARRGSNDRVSVLELEDIQLWAHDMGVEPGAEYRYRTRVVVNNPLFRKGPAFDPNDAAQQALTKDPFTRGQWSSWSDTVLVGARQYFFVKSADPSGLHAESPKASIEVARMYYGHYRKSTISIEPGGKLHTNARVAGRMVTIDPDVVDAGKAGDQLATLMEDTRSELPEGFSEVEGRLMIDLGVYLLEIALDPVAGVDASGNTVQATQLILRGADGGLIVRSSINDGVDSEAYELVSESSSQASKTPMRVSGQSAVSPSYELFPESVEP